MNEKDGEKREREREAISLQLCLSIEVLMLDQIIQSYQHLS